MQRPAEVKLFLVYEAKEKECERYTYSGADMATFTTFRGDSFDMTDKTYESRYCVAGEGTCEPNCDDSGSNSFVLRNVGLTRARKLKIERKQSGTT